MNPIEVHNLDFSYANTNVLRNINLYGKPGEIIAIMGLSGSGKSTLLKVMTGLLDIDSGSINIFGERMGSIYSHRKQWENIRRKFGVAFQYGGLLSDLNIFENIALPLKEIACLPDNIIEIMVKIKLEAVGLRGAVNLKPSQLSGGMIKRVALARAIALDPQLIFYDEPYSGLDPISSAIASRLIKTINVALGACSVIVTHQLDSTINIVDRTYIMSEGKIIGDGSIKDLTNSGNKMIKQFFNQEIDGPIAFHYPAPSILSDI